MWDAGNLAIEICVTNPMDDDRIRFYEQAGLDCIEINLAHLAKQFANGKGLVLSDVNHAVLRDPHIREWRCRPEWIFAMLKASGELDSVPYFGNYTVRQGDAAWT